MKKVLILYASYGGGHLSAAKSIQKYIEDEIAEMLLRSEVMPGQTVKVDCKKDELKFTVVSKTSKSKKSE